MCTRRRDHKYIPCIPKYSLRTRILPNWQSALDLILPFSRVQKVRQKSKRER